MKKRSKIISALLSAALLFIMAVHVTAFAAEKEFVQVECIVFCCITFVPVLCLSELAVELCKF